MKKLFIFIVELMVISNAMAQGCLPDSIEFRTQSQIDSFQINYPGCTRILGNVAIYPIEFDGITNLKGLSVLTSIGGNLFVACYSLDSLSGLENVTSIGGYLSIHSGPYGWGWGSTLKSLKGLRNLISVGGALRLIGLGSLMSLTGLENLKTVGGELRIYGNGITSLSGLDNIIPSTITSITIQNNGLLADCHVKPICDYLASPNGTVNIYGNATGCKTPWDVSNGCGTPLSCLPYGNYYFFSQSDIDSFHEYSTCTALNGNVCVSGEDIVNLNGLRDVTSVVGDLSIGLDTNNLNGWTRLKDLSGLENLKYIDGTLQITSNDSLVSLAGLDNLNSVGGDLLIGVNFVHSNRSNIALASLAGLRNLKSIRGELQITNSALTSLSGLDSLTYLGGNLNIYGNELLTSMSGIGNLTSIGGGLELRWNALKSISGLANLSSLGGGIKVHTNWALKNLEGLEKLTTIGNGVDGLSIHQHDSLVSLKGLDNLILINGPLGITSDPQLPSMAGLSSLRTVWGEFKLYEIPALTSLQDLENLKHIGGDLIIEKTGLTNLNGLDNIYPSSINNLTIMDNLSLSNCSVRSICDYIYNPSGISNIGYNATGCWFSWEVKAGCDTLSTVDLSCADPFSIYPNPTNGKITIETNQKAQFALLNLNGMQLIEKPISEFKTTIDISNLKPGLYIVKLTGEQGVSFGKIVKE